MKGKWVRTNIILKCPVCGWTGKGDMSNINDADAPTKCLKCSGHVIVRQLVEREVGSDKRW